jgi:membrane protein implicated in regulation of membrane protease activity
LYQFLIGVYEAILQAMLQLPPRVYAITLVFIALAAGLIAIEAIATAMVFGVVCVLIFMLYGLGIVVQKTWRAVFKSGKRSPQGLAEAEVLMPGNSRGGRLRQFLSALYGLILQRILGLPSTLIGAVLVLACFAGAVIAIEAIATVLVVGALLIITFAIYGIGLLLIAGWRAFRRQRASVAREREHRSGTGKANQEQQVPSSADEETLPAERERQSSKQVPVST